MAKFKPIHNTTLLLDQPTGGLTVPPQSVANVSVITEIDSTTADFMIGAGAGAHIIFPVLPAAGDFNIWLKAGARVTLSLLGKDSLSHRLNFIINLDGEGANIHFQVAVIHSASSHSDFTCTLNHSLPNTYGRIVSRRIVLDEARSALKGLLRVDEAAQGTDTYLSDKALLLGQKSEATSDPRLEILANDVKASHGAAIGKMSDEELFYIRSRGIPLPEAEGLLAMSFLQPALVGVPPDLVRSLSLGANVF